MLELASVTTPERVREKRRFALVRTGLTFAPTVWVRSCNCSCLVTIFICCTEYGNSRPQSMQHTYARSTRSRCGHVVCGCTQSNRYARIHFSQLIIDLLMRDRFSNDFGYTPCDSNWKRFSEGLIRCRAWQCQFRVTHSRVTFYCPRVCCGFRWDTFSAPLLERNPLAGSTPPQLRSSSACS